MITIESTTPAILAAYNYVFKKTTTKFASKAAGIAAAEKTIAAWNLMSVEERHALGHNCPHCCGDASSQTANGEDGTIAGDEQLFCHECGTSYWAANGKAIKARAKGEGSDAIKASWQDEEVRAARTKRDAVKVGDDTFKSFARALKVLGITPVGFHKARLQLKAAGKLDYAGHTFTIA